MLAGIGPAGGIEAMLACQMVAAHEAAMACFARAAIAAAPPERIDREVRHGERLMSLFARQAAALDRLRARAAPADARDRADDAPEPVVIRRDIVDPEEWRAAQAHVLDPRVVLARGRARGAAIEAGLSEDETKEAVAWVVAAVEANPPTIGGKPYILDSDGVRVYPLHDCGRQRMEGVTDTPLDDYFDRIRDRDGEAAAAAARAAARGANGRAPPAPPGR
jgi:NAD(P)H-hydrate repair Nnr-like enzyme with NAD(P)H-hydrate dehydratase domain